MVLFVFLWPFFVALNLSYFLCYFTPSLPSMCTPIRRIDSSSRLSIVKKDFGSSSSKIEITTLQHVYARQEVNTNPSNLINTKCK